MQLIDNNPETQTPVLVNIADLRLHVTLEEFDRLCQLNRDLKLRKMQI
jgi:hypothetical protein